MTVHIMEGKIKAKRKFRVGQVVCNDLGGPTSFCRIEKIRRDTDGDWYYITSDGDDITYGEYFRALTIREKGRIGDE